MLIPLHSRFREPSKLVAWRRPSQRRPVSDGVEVVFKEAFLPAARPPRLRLFTSGVRLEVEQLEENVIAFLAGPSEDCLVTVVCDARRTTVRLTAGMGAETAATVLGANVPHGFRALVDGATVAVWKDADLFSAVA